MARLAQVLHGGITGPDQIAHRFILRIRDVNGSQFPGAKQPGQLVGITPVGLDLVRSLPGNERRRHHLAMKTFGAQMATEHEAAGTGFINQAQFDPGLRKFFNQLVHGIERAADDAVTTDFSGVGRRDGHGDGFLVDVQTEIMDD